MDVAAVVSSGERLMKAFEASQIPQGEGLISNGPSPVPNELVNEFRALLDSPQQSQLQVDTSQWQNQPIADRIEPTEKIAQSNELVQMNPQDLLQVQFEVSQILTLSRFSNTVSRGASQNFDQILRSKG